ncbi:hypothetical protein KIN20_028874 [Parelaphostrongylus tenuis]|uniref:Uncharacterized protein n=1 Tax=Parelaphostrongylus tenuis TaxID=148309 RepID=A0AAD5WF14_PARTN|nr:hypothetical protein KIN20_028874 [Parelaphostrongylus tenuis]
MSRIRAFKEAADQLSGPKLRANLINSAEPLNAPLCGRDVMSSYILTTSRPLRTTHSPEDGEPCRNVSHHDCCNIRVALSTVLLYASLILTSMNINNTSEPLNKRRYREQIFE